MVRAGLLGTGLALAIALAGCGAASGGGSAGNVSSRGVSRPAPGAAPGQGSSGRHGPGRRHGGRARAHRRPSDGGRAPSGLAYSRASNYVVQRQGRPGSCRAIGSGPYERPDPRCTPGALNPAVTQATIGKTICVSGWTSTVRPPESVTEVEKEASLGTYGDGGPLGAYEYDHLVPLELGGATNDPRNLWPEPGASPNPKDSVEFSLRERVCDGQMSLASAQRAIARDWVALAGRGVERGSSRSGGSKGSTGAAGSGGGECSASASYNNRYHDYDVYVHSNQPDQTVTVSVTGGASRRWHTDGSGYADVYFNPGGRRPGVRVAVRVGSAICSTTL